MALGAVAPRWRDTVGVGRAARAVTGLVLVQWTIGLVTLLLLVPIPMQLLHLLTADLLWTAVIWLGAVLLADQARTSETINATASASMSGPAPILDVSNGLRQRQRGPEGTRTPQRRIG